MTSPWMPPVSPTAYGFLPNSMNEYCPRKPCHPSVVTHGGSTRPVDGVAELLAGPFAIENPVQSALSQYTAPGTRRLVGRWAVADSSVFANAAAMVELPAPVVPSTGPPES